MGSCAVTGNPSGQRNSFLPGLKKEIEPVVKKYKLNRKVFKLDELVKVDDFVAGCPMNETVFLNVLDKYLKEFGVANART
ncbi:MAG: hypothetical protein HYW50_01615 [Candidatus Diapherotrites archaeon]|nr:hypothetical protein [Candidatus Diapherotrites archaeon]